MNFDKESKSEEKYFFERGGGGVQTEKKKKKKTLCVHLLSVLYIEFQVPSSSHSLVLPQTKGA